MRPARGTKSHGTCPRTTSGPHHRPHPWTLLALSWTSTLDICPGKGLVPPRGVSVCLSGAQSQSVPSRGHPHLCQRLGVTLHSTALPCAVALSYPVSCTAARGFKLFPASSAPGGGTSPRFQTLLTGMGGRGRPPTCAQPGQGPKHGVPDSHKSDGVTWWGCLEVLPDVLAQAVLGGLPAELRAPLRQWNQVTWLSGFRFGPGKSSAWSQGSVGHAQGPCGGWPASDKGSAGQTRQGTRGQSDSTVGRAFALPAANRFSPWHLPGVISELPGVTQK